MVACAAEQVSLPFILLSHAVVTRRYIERLILGNVAGSSAIRDFESLCGYQILIKTVNEWGADHECVHGYCQLIEMCDTCACTPSCSPA